MPASSITRWRTLAALTALVVCACTPAATVTAPALDGTKCRKDALDTLYPGILTFGADQPVYPPWYLGDLSLIHISEPTRRLRGSRMPSSA